MHRALADVHAPERLRAVPLDKSLVGVLLATRRDRHVTEHGRGLVGEVAEHEAAVVVGPAEETAGEGEHPVAGPDDGELVLVLRLRSKQLLHRLLPLPWCEGAERGHHRRRVGVVVLGAFEVAGTAG
uniref:Uncharacterized protein n=1 Tax=Arundo donax TaxID=35708 RepID=A0A0A8Z8N7_ARUDO